MLHPVFSLYERSVVENTIFHDKKKRKSNFVLALVSLKFAICNLALKKISPHILNQSGDYFPAYTPALLYIAIARFAF